MDGAQPRERLLIGEVARLLGITPKAIRHYEKLGLLEKPGRSESGYRLYTADDLVRLHQIKKLQSLGLSLERVKGVLGEGRSGIEFESVLEALLGEVERQITDLEQRRNRLQKMLVEDTPSETVEETNEEPYAFELARQHLGESWSNVDPELLDQMKKLWTTLDEFEWPQGYEGVQEAIVFYMAEHPEEYGEMLVLEERLAALAYLPEESPEVDQLAADYVAYFEKSSFLEEVSTQTDWSEGPMGNALSGVILNTVSPAQKRCMELLQERISESQQKAAEQ